MELFQLYSIILGTLFVYGILSGFIPRVRDSISFKYRKYIHYPQIYKYLRGTAKATVSDAILILALLFANALCVGIRVKDRTGLIKRSGLMALANMIPLAFGSRIAFIAYLFGIDSELYRRAHNWIGRTLVVEGILHSILAASSNETLSRNIVPLVVCNSRSSTTTR